MTRAKSSEVVLNSSQLFRTNSTSHFAHIATTSFAIPALPAISLLQDPFLTQALPSGTVALMTALSAAAETALATFRNEDALAIAHRRKANVALDRFLTIINHGESTASIATPTNDAPRCVQVWTKWLQDNGPNTRQHITEQTGVRFSERGTPYTLRWGDDLLYSLPNLIQPSTIIRFRGTKPPGQRGAAPTIFALWSQIFDVYPLFGVGPERPDETALRQQTDEAIAQSRLSSGLLMVPQSLDSSAHGTDDLVEKIKELVAQPIDPDDLTAMTGVIRPVPDFDWTDAEHWPNGTIDEALQEEEPTNDD